MMKHIEHKKHHYVPVCYLRNFSFNQGDIVNVYDKITGNQFSKNVKDLCYLDGFYTLSEECIKAQEDQSINTLSLELYFADPIESEYNRLLSWLTEETDLIPKKGSTYLNLTKEKKYLLARQITIQKIRTPNIRSKIVENERYVAEKMLRLFEHGLSKELNNCDIEELPIDVSIDEVLFHANKSFLDEGQVDDIANHLSNCYWHFYYSPTEEFYTSDNPVTIENRGNDSYEQHFGLTNKGVEVSIPINPRLLLSIYDYRYYSIYKESDGLFAEAHKEHIQYKNLCQYVFSTRIVINKTGVFSAAIEAKDFFDNKKNFHS